MEPLIRFEKVSKSFGRLQVFDSLDLEINRGEAIAVLGESGKGKSVMLKMLIGLLEPDSGSIWFDGVNLAELDEEGFQPIRKRIAMCFQGNALFDSLTVAENVAYPLEERSDMTDDAIEATVVEKLELVGLADAANKYPSQISGGMKKRVALARAIASEPEVILYDEPTTGLDPPNTRRISDLMCSLNEKLCVTSIIVTHDLACAFFVADHVALIGDKKIVTVMPKDEMFRSPREEVREFVEAMPRW